MSGRGGTLPDLSGLGEVLYLTFLREVGTLSSGLSIP